MGAGHRVRRALIGLAVGLGLLTARPADAERTFIPVPVIILDPDEGNTYGLLGVIMFLDDQGDVRYMLAPDVQYNATKGVYPTFRFFGYPSRTREYSVSIGKSTTKDEGYELEFSEDALWDERAFVDAFALYERESTERFYGFGNDTLESDESNYTTNDTRAWVEPGVRLWPEVELSYRMRIRRFEVERGQVDSVPFIAEEHPEVRGRGLETGVYWAHQVAFGWDSRDDDSIPRRGTLARAYTEVADRVLGSSTSFVKFGAEFRKFIPFRKARNPILGLRANLDYTSGSGDTPFWEQSRLGGRRDLRGYGGSRFVDLNRSLAGAELRTRVWRQKLFGVNAEIEVAPFFETGQVFHQVTDSPVDDLHFAYGVGFRGIARPQIVGFVDVGRSREGTVVFSGIRYPF